MAIVGALAVGGGSRKTYLPVVGGSSSNVFTDSFARADQNLEASADWTLTGAAGAAAIVTNAVNFVGQSKTNPTFYTAPSAGNPDQFAECVFNSALSISGFPLACRVDVTTGNYVAVRPRGSSGYQAFHFAGGVLSQLAGPGGAAVASGDVVRLIVVGSTVAIYVNGVQYGANATTSVLTGNLPGMVVRGGNEAFRSSAWRSGAGMGG